MKKNIGTLDDIKFPKVLYKYRDWQNPRNRRFITLREVYMASPNQFEDEFDCKIPIRYDLMTSKEAEKFYNRLAILSDPNMSRQKRRKEVRLRMKFKDYLNHSKNIEYQQFYFNEYFKRIGIFSLTKNKCLDEMWSKYANQHKGFCVGYNSRVLFEYLGGGGIVEYFDELPVLMPDPIMSREETRNMQVYSKERKWEFENEYRTQKFWINGGSLKDRQVVIPKEAFNCVILGKNISQEDRNEIISAVRENIGDIPIFDQRIICP